MSKEVNSVNTNQEIKVDAEKRAFMKKFGKYAVVGAGMTVLMTPTASRAGGSSAGVTSHRHGFRFNPHNGHFKNKIKEKLMNNGHLQNYFASHRGRRK